MEYRFPGEVLIRVILRREANAKLLWDRLIGLSPAQMGLIVFLTALVVRLTGIFWMGMHTQPLNFVEVEKIAVSIVETGVFGNPYKIPTGPTAHAAPFYPYLLAGVFKLAGYGLAARVIVLLISAFAVSMQYALLPKLAVRCGIPAYVGLVAGLMGAVIPVRLITELNGFEAPISGMVWVLALIVTLGWLEAPSVRRSMVCGAIWGLEFLIVPPMLLPFGLMLTGLWWWDWRGRPGPGRVQILLAAAMAVLLITPWTIRNYLVFGQLLFIRNNIGLELSTTQFPGVSLTDDEYHPGNAFVQQRHPYTSEASAREVLALGEIAFNRQRMQQAVGYIKVEPREFVWRTVQRIWIFWFLPSRFPAYKNAYIFFFTAAGLWGTMMMWRRRPVPGLCFVCGIAGFPAIYYLMKVMSRYRYPIEWMLLFLCCYTVWAYLEAGGDRPEAMDT